jgi:PmbA protein
VGEGLLVQSVSGLHSGVNPVSGDFSVGAEGLLVHDGALASPVRELTIASSIQRMLLGVIAIGNDLEWLPSSAAGLTMAISEMSMSGE